ncbi:MAG: IS66 family transposase [Bacillota bacterium]|nr:IS66 family transposase [Bacillota bacterium]
MTVSQSYKHCNEGIVAPNNETQVQDLLAENEQLKVEVAALRLKVAHYEELLRIAAKQRYGQSSEKRQDVYRDGYVQQDFFNEIEAGRSEDPSLEEVLVEDSTETTGASEKTPRRKRVPLSEKVAQLPVQDKVYELPDEELQCHCGHTMDPAGTRVHHELILIPARVEVVRHHRQVYFCHHCQVEDIRTPHRTASGPRPFLGGGLASTTSVAYLVDRKFNQHVPLYRLEKEFADQLGFSVTRATMCNWLSNTHERVLKPALELLKETVLESGHIHMDETVLQVLKEEGREAKQKSHMWVLATGNGSPVAEWYEYQPRKDSLTIRRMLKDYKGTLQVDGYRGFDTLVGQAQLIGCWAHARRKFTDLEASLPKEAKKSSVLVQGALRRIGALYNIEDTIQEARDKLPPEEREQYTFEQRQEWSRPLVDEYFTWLKKILPKVHGSQARRAIKYSLGQEEKLRRYLDSGRAQIDNNLALSAQYFNPHLSEKTA